jgi:branched-chain amino acid transport system ATP-binding protein
MSEPAPPTRAGPAEATLSTHGLAVGHGGRAVLRGLDISVRAGEIVALLGRNGVGKTTAIMTVAGLLPPLAGDIYFGGGPLKGGLNVRAKAGIAYVGEERAVIRRLSVTDNLRLSGVDADTVYQLFPELAELRRRPAGLLSGGEQQMLALGRSLAASAKLLLIDELSLGLGPMIVNRLWSVLRSSADTGTAILVVEQKPALALANSDIGYVLANGGVALKGTAHDLIGGLDEIERLYLSEGSLRAHA